MDDVMNATGIRYPYVVASEMTGEAIKAVLEDIATTFSILTLTISRGGDMVRVSGRTYSCNPTASIGSRIGDMKLGGRPIDKLDR